MLRTCSHALLGATALVGLTALSGCTVYTYSAPPRHTYVAPAQAAPPPPRAGAYTGRKPANPTVVGTPAQPPPALPPPASAPLITAPNAFGSATPAAFRGLAYVIPANSSRLPTLDSLVPFATLYTDSFDIPAQTFNIGFPGALKQSEWFAIRYDGSFNVSADGLCTFEVLSADGSILYVDGQPVVNNDGVHGAIKGSGKATLRTGLHQLRLDYFKGSQGTIALRVFVTVGNGPQSLLVGVRQ